MPTGTSKQELFVTVGNAVNYCHKDIYYTCCKSPRCASETSYYKSFERNNLRQCQKQQKSGKTIYIFLGGGGDKRPRGIFPEGFFRGWGKILLGAFFPGAFFLTPNKMRCLSSSLDKFEILVFKIETDQKTFVFLLSVTG